jgi:hypothetical protein
MTTIIYAAIAIAFLIMVIGFLRKPLADDLDETSAGKRYAPKVGNGRWLDLSERIFDPSDARWLEEELAFPKLAQDLILERKRLAICWLQFLQASFDDLVRTPEIATSGDPEESSAGSWQLLWLTLRFKFLVSYALVVVRLFGPYHRLIPSFAWVPLSHEGGHSVRRAAMASTHNSH